MALLKVEVVISDETLQQLVDWMEQYEDTTTTVAELKKNPKIVEWFQNDIDSIYFSDFVNGLENCSVADDLDI